MAATRTIIVGAGPTGLYCAIALARRGHDVTLADRDAGPGPGGPGNARESCSSITPMVSVTRSATRC